VRVHPKTSRCSPFGGIPRNWKPAIVDYRGASTVPRSPFGGIPRNWKLDQAPLVKWVIVVPPSGGSLEIGNSVFLYQLEVFL